MNVKSDDERKSKVLKIRLNGSEFAKLKQYTEESGLRSMSQYMLNSIIATPIIELTDEKLAPDMARLKEISARLAEYQAKLERFAVTPQTFRAIVDKAHEDVRK